jgi:hypothetical protein
VFRVPRRPVCDCASCSNALLIVQRCGFAYQKLWTYQGNFRAFKVLIAAEYNGIDIEVPEFAAADNKVLVTQCSNYYPSVA